MGDKLTIHRREVDLDDVKKMTKQEYADLMRYVNQWDEPNSAASWTAQLAEARGEEGVEPVDNSTYGDWEADELKGELERRGLKVSGRKAELIARLEEHDEETSAIPE